MVKIVIDAGEEAVVSGGRRPADDGEWFYNEKVVRAIIAKLETYEAVDILRVDDPTGKVAIPIQERNDRANDWEVDIYVSIHHNVLWEDKWGHSRIEKNLINDQQQLPDGATARYPRIVKSMEVRDRSHNRVNFHVFRETAIPAILKEGGFMDSVVDVIKLRDENYLWAEGEAIADGLAANIKLEPKARPINITAESYIFEDKLYTPTAEELVEATTIVLQHLEADSEGVIPSSWLKKIHDGSLTDSDSVCLLYVVIHRWLTQETD